MPRAEIPEFDKRLRPIKRAFLRALVLGGGSITKAAAICQLSREVHYIWKEKDALYRQELERAHNLSTERLEDEMLRRAFEGVRKPIFNGGKQAQMFAVDEEGNPLKGPDGKYQSVPAVIREFSDTLLIFALKARKPDTYRERYEQRITGQVNVDVRAAIMAVMDVLPDDARAIAARKLLELEKAG